MNNILQFTTSQDISGVELMRAHFKSNTASLHYHDDFTIGVMESGVQSYCPKGNKVISKGHISIVNPGRMHSNKSLDEDGYRYRTFNISPQVLCQIANDIVQNEINTPSFDHLSVKDKFLETKLFQLHDCLFFNQLDTIQMQSLFYETFAYLIQTHNSDKTLELKASVNSAIINRVKEYLHTYYDTKITLEQLSQVSGISTYYLNRVFSKSQGLPPHKYLMNLRLNRALDLLKGKNTITEVGYMVGFFDQSHFIRNFKSFLGITPKEYQLAISK